jgi:hypothetical protein
MSVILEKIKDLESKLKSYSRGLSNKNYLIDKAWTFIDGDLKIQRIIFKNGGVLYLTKDGIVTESTWEYLPAINALLLKIGNDKILFHEIYLNNVALILKKDSTQSDFIALVNPQSLGNLNLIEYLNEFELYFNKKHGNRIPVNKNKSIISQINNFLKGI